MPLRRLRRQTISVRLGTLNKQLRLIVIFQSQMRNQLLTRIQRKYFSLHELDKDVVLG